MQQNNYGQNGSYNYQNNNPYGHTGSAPVEDYNVVANYQAE